MKFRVWNGLECKYYVSPVLMGDGTVLVDGEPLSDGDVFELCTGLQDISGIDIYAGDIVEHPVKDRPYSKKARKCMARKEIYWKGCLYNGENLSDPGFSGRAVDDSEESSWGYDWCVMYKCRIVGNIHNV